MNMNTEFKHFLSNLAHVTFNPDIVIKLGQHFFESHPYLVSMNALQIKVKLSDSTYLALGSWLITEISGQPHPPLNKTVLTEINNKLSYFVNSSGYDKAHNKDALNDNSFAREVMEAEKNTSPILSFERYIEQYGVALMDNDAQRSRLKSVLLRLIYDSALSDFAKLFYLNDSASMGKLIAFVVMLNHERNVFLKLSIKVQTPMQKAVAFCLKYLMPLHKKELISQDELSDSIVSLLKGMTWFELIEKMAKSFRHFFNGNAEKIKGWYLQHESIFNKFVTAPNDRAKLRGYIQKLQYEVESCVFIHSFCSNFFTDASAFISSLETGAVKKNLRATGEGEALYGKHLMANKTGGYEKNLITNILTQFYGDLVKENERLPALPQRINSLYAVLMSNEVIDTNAQKLYAEYVVFSRKNMAAVNDLLGCFEALAEKIEIQGEDSNEFASKKWKPIVEKLRVPSPGQNMNNRWMVMKTCALKMQTYQGYIAELSSIITDFEQCINKMMQCLKIVSNRQSEILKEHISSLLLENSSILTDMRTMHKMCSELYEDTKGILQDLSKQIKAERPVALLQFFFKYGVDQRLVADCRKEAIANLEQSLNLITSCK